MGQSFYSGFVQRTHSTLIWKTINTRITSAETRVSSTYCLTLVKMSCKCQAQNIWAPSEPQTSTTTVESSVVRSFVELWRPFAVLYRSKLHGHGCCPHLPRVIFPSSSGGCPFYYTHIFLSKSSCGSITDDSIDFEHNHPFVIPLLIVLFLRTFKSTFPTPTCCIFRITTYS